MGLYENTEGVAAESNENLANRDGAESSASEYSDQQERGKILVCITFFLELLILGAVITLEYFLR